MVAISSVACTSILNQYPHEQPLGVGVLGLTCSDETTYSVVTPVIRQVSN